jgi:5-azacytidine-induced protein 1
MGPLCLTKAHNAQIESLREQYETGQEGWRAAIADRARKELSDKEAAIRAELTRERDAEIEAVVRRLEAENAVAVEEAREGWRRREEALVSKQAAALKEAKKNESR